MDEKLSPNMKQALDSVLTAHPEPYTPTSSPTIKGLAALARRGLVKQVGEPAPFRAPSYTLPDNRSGE